MRTKLTIARMFAKGEKADAAKAADGDIVGAEDLKEQILAGKSDFDRVIATPDMMAVVSSQEFPDMPVGHGIFWGSFQNLIE